MKSKAKSERKKRGGSSRAARGSAGWMAAKVAEAIMTAPCDGKRFVRCHRLAFKVGQYPDNEKDMGGLCHSALEGIILASLQANGYPPNDAGQPRGD